MKSMGATALLLILSVSNATSIIATARSVANSPFCRKYQCKITNNAEDVLPEGYISYSQFKVKTYLLKNGIRLITYGLGNSDAVTVAIRDSGITLKRGFGKATDTLTSDFFLAFIGVAPQHDCKTIALNPYYEAKGISSMGNLGNLTGYTNLCFVTKIPNLVVKSTIYVTKTSN